MLKKRPSRRRGTRVFHHNGRQTLALFQMGARHEDGWLRECRARRSAWAAAARERLLREGWTQDDAGRWHEPQRIEETA